MNPQRTRPRRRVFGRPPKRGATGTMFGEAKGIMEEPLDYIGVNLDGFIRAATVGDGDRKQLAETLKEFVNDGLIIERATCEYVRQNFGKKFDRTEALKPNPQPKPQKG
jgi:hypothetical protein